MRLIIIGSTAIALLTTLFAYLFGDEEVSQRAGDIAGGLVTFTVVALFMFWMIFDD